MREKSGAFRYLRSWILAWEQRLLATFKGYFSVVMAF